MAAIELFRQARKIAPAATMPDMKHQPTNPAVSQPRRAMPASELLATVAACTIAAVAGHQLLGDPGTAAGSPLLPARDDLCRRIDDAYLSGTLYGAIDRTIEWRGTNMQCDGGLRPGDAGIRLVFAAPDGPGDDRLVFVIGIGGQIDMLVNTERAANLTIIDESDGRFFSSGGGDRCWTTIAAVDRIDDLWQIEGEVYCSGSLPSLSDGAAVALRNFRYAGRLSSDGS